MLALCSVRCSLAMLTGTSEGRAERLVAEVPKAELAQLPAEGGCLC